MEKVLYAPNIFRKAGETMGSVHGPARCPQCGYKANYGNWYHSNSWIFDCDVCGWNAGKMIYYHQCVDINDPSVDEYGYQRWENTGYGVYIINDLGYPLALVKKTPNETLEEALIRHEGRQKVFKAGPKTDIEMQHGELLCETWFIGKRRVRISITEAGKAFAEKYEFYLWWKDVKTYVDTDGLTYIKNELAEGCRETDMGVSFDWNETPEGSEDFFYNEQEDIIPEQIVLKYLREKGEPV